MGVVFLLGRHDDNVHGRRVVLLKEHWEYHEACFVVLLYILSLLSSTKKIDPMSVQVGF